MRKLFALLITLPAIASAQEIYVAPAPQIVVAPPPRVYVPPPPVYIPAPLPPRVYIRQRVRWHFRPRPIYVASVAPVAQPVYVAPAPTIVVAAPPPPRWTSTFGLGVRGSGAVSDNWSLGVGGELLLRASSHVSLELGAAYERRTEGFDRMDVPATLGVRLHIGKPDWVVSPYFVAAAGIDWAHENLLVTHDDAYYFDGQLGGGIEIRVGQHFAITADARFDGKKRLDSANEAVLATRSVNGKPVRALGDEYGGQFRLGVAAYF
jgi:hypothetical protein